MGIVLDSSVTITAERKGETAERLIQHIMDITGNQPLALSAVGYTELVHGIYRANTAARRVSALAFLNHLTDGLPVFAYTKEIAATAGRIDAEQAIAGYPIPFADLLVGATALHHSYAVLTVNVRHFNLIPGLEVIPFNL